MSVSPDMQEKFDAHEILPSAADNSQPAPEPRAAVPNTQWQYVCIGEEGDVYGTNDVKAAKELCATDMVIHVPTCQRMEVLEDGTIEYHNIKQQSTYEF